VNIYESLDATAAKGYDAGVAAERERLRLAILGCSTCGKVHEYRPETGDCGKPHKSGHYTWADPDNGHTYAPLWRTHGPEDSASFLRRVLAEPTTASGTKPQQA